MQQIEADIICYRDTRIKLFLGGLSPAEFRTKWGVPFSPIKSPQAPSTLINYCVFTSNVILCPQKQKYGAYQLARTIIFIPGKVCSCSRKRSAAGTNKNESSLVLRLSGVRAIWRCLFPMGSFGSVSL